LQKERRFAIADESGAPFGKGFGSGGWRHQADMPAEQKDEARLAIADRDERRSGDRRMLGHEVSGGAAQP
jgi:hypothetical protein